MTYRNFTLLGEELIEAWACETPFRANRLITTLEAFVCGGPATRVAPVGAQAAEVEVYLTPPRYVLRGVSDAAALLLVDHRSERVRLIEVIRDYVETDEQVWLDLVARAERAIEAND